MQTERQWEQRLRQHCRLGVQNIWVLLILVLVPWTRAEGVNGEWLAQAIQETMNWPRLSIDSQALHDALVDVSTTTDVASLATVLRRTEMLVDDIDTVLGDLHRLQTEAADELIPYPPHGFELVDVIEELLVSMSQLSNSLDEALHSATTSSKMLPTTFEYERRRVSQALNALRKIGLGRELADAIQAERLSLLFLRTDLVEIGRDMGYKTIKPREHLSA